MKQNENELVNIIRLIRSENIGNITFIKLVEMFGSPTEAIANLPSLLKFSKKNIKLYSQKSAEKEINNALKQNIHLISYLHEYYPPLLRQLEDYPPLLFVKGHAHLLKKSSVAIVGSRNASINGQKQAFNFAKELGEQGFLIVSGMAKGIDSSAHSGALAKGTIAVLGGGVDVIYPSESKKLYEDIHQHGAIISEFPVGQKPIPTNFPKRNRIIAGMARGLLVVEASLNSGSLISANFALEQGKDVFAIPGFPTDPRAKGTNKLIKEGAILTENVCDIINNLKNFNLHEDITIPNFKLQKPKLQEKDLLAPRKFLHNILSVNPIAVDVLVQESSFSYGQITTILLELELNGKLERLPNNHVALIAKCEKLEKAKIIKNNKDNYEVSNSRIS
ncbi:DNA-protecting protein DprA [Candidatus Hepatincola sp. Pdp]